MAELLILVLFGIGLICLLLWEIGQWRRTGAVLSARQRRLRVTVIGLLGMVLGLMGASLLDVFQTPLEQLTALACMLVLAGVTFLLALVDFRELRARKQEREMRAYGEMVRFMASVAQAKRAVESAAETEEDGGNGRSEDV